MGTGANVSGPGSWSMGSPGCSGHWTTPRRVTPLRLKSDNSWTLPGQGAGSFSQLLIRIAVIAVGVLINDTAGELVGACGQRRRSGCGA